MENSPDSLYSVEEEFREEIEKKKNYGYRISFTISEWI